jgi:hypothetical protein
VNNANFSKKYITLFRLPVSILVLSKTGKYMGTKIETQHTVGWKLLKSADLDFDFGQENESSEDDEYNFYRYAGNDHNLLEIDKQE